MSNATSLSASKEFVTAMGVDYGGTKILKPLRHALNVAPVAACSHSVSGEPSGSNGPSAAS